MRIAGQWVGLGLGDSSDEIRRLKLHMRKKFGYAADLKDTTLFDQQMVDAVVEMQRRYNASGVLKTGAYTPGIVNVATKVACGFVVVPQVDARPVLFTVCGTSVPWWVGPDADTARAVEDKYFWQPVGYPAKAVPMGPSIQAGKDELYVQMQKRRDRIVRYGCAFASYSQGAIVVSETWEDDIKPATGKLAWVKPYVRKAVCWGNPSRERGRVWPDAGGRTAGQTSSGVTGRLMVDTPTWWRNYAHQGDLYTDVPADGSAENRLAIWQIIRDGSMFKGPDSLLRQVLELGGTTDGTSVAEMTAMVKAMLDALVFFGGGTKPHINYSTAEAISYLREA